MSLDLLCVVPAGFCHLRGGLWGEAYLDIVDFATAKDPPGVAKVRLKVEVGRYVGIDVEQLERLEAIDPIGPRFFLCRGLGD